MWICGKCKRRFTRPNQRHACGTGNRAQVVRDRPAAIVALYEEIEAFARNLGPVEIVARERYVLFRSVRIFADLVIMKEAVRIALHLGRRVKASIFFKVVTGPRFITHVAKLETQTQFEEIAPLLKEAYQHSLGRAEKS